MWTVSCTWTVMEGSVWTVSCTWMVIHGGKCVDSVMYMDGDT